MKFTGTLVAPRIDFLQFRQRLHDELLEALSLAAFEWLNATADTIPQWSGASAATFLHLAREIGYTLPINQASSAPFNGVSLGQRESSGSFDADPASGRYTFSYSTRLDHLIYNEFNNANVTPDPGLFFRLRNPGPYRFQARGSVAFLRVASSVRLPSPFERFQRKLIRIR